MSLSVLNNLSAIYAENNLNKTSTSLSKVLSELSSGSKINSGADDAAGLSLVDGLEANQAALTQSGTNATEGVGLLTVADGALSQVTNLLNRAVTLATEAANGTLNSTQDQAANQEYQSILSEISNIGSTTTYNQQSVFGTVTNIYTGDSTSNGASLDSLNIRSLSASNVGDTAGSMSYSSGTDNVFVDLSNAGTNAAVTDSLGSSSSTSNVTVDYMTKGTNGSVVQATATISVGAGTGYDNTVKGLISAINNSGLGLSASFGTAASAGTGAINTALAAAGSNNTLRTSSSDTGIVISGTGIGVNTAGSNGVGVVGTLAISNTSGSDAADAAALNGTLSVTGSDGTAHTVVLGMANSTDTLNNLAAYVNKQGWGVTAAYNDSADDNTASVVFTAGSNKAGITETSSSLTATGAGNNTVSLASQPEVAGSASTTTLDKVSGSANGGNLVIGTNTMAISKGESFADLANAINSANYGVTASVDTANGNLLIHSADSIAPTISTTDSGLQLAVVDKTSSPFYSVGISGNINDTSTGGGTSVVGMSNDTNGHSGIATISYSDSAGVSLANTDLSNQSDAQATLTGLNTAIADVAAQDGYIGAQINLLNAVSSVLSTQSENVTAAQNAIQATDYASATSNMSKYQILSQTGIAALAQANAMQQEVAKLLQ